MNAILKGVRPSDYVLAALFSAAGAFLMYMNVAALPDDPSLAHPVESNSWLMLPVFLLVTVPILWRRRNILAVVAATTAATAIHVLAFGWATRCGVGLPLAAALAYAVARFAGNRGNHLFGLGGVVLLILAILVQDSSTGGILGALPIALPLAALLYGIGLVVQTRVTRKQQAESPAPAHVAA